MFSRIFRYLSEQCNQLLTAPAVATLALMVALSTVFCGFMLDDYLHLAILEGKGAGATPLDLFVFGAGEPKTAEGLMERGIYPWYTLPELKIHFFRPLSSAAMWIDHALFGRAAILHHLHSAAWYALLALSIMFLFRRALPAPVAGLAVLLYILDDGHIGPVQWLSNRNAIVSAAPAFLGLVAHVRWREDGWRTGLPLSLAGFSLGLLGGETAVGIFGFLVAYELFGRRDALRLRIGALAPGLTLALSYALAYKLLGYGVSGSGAYIDPVGEWRLFLFRAPGRLLDLISAQFFKLPVELPVMTGSAVVAAVFRMLTLLAVVLLGVATRRIWQRLSAQEQRGLIWIGAGSLLATVPALSALPATRLLVLPSAGACALAAAILVHGLQGPTEQTTRIPRVLARVFVVLLILMPPVLWLGRGVGVPVFQSVSADAFSLPDVEDGAVSDKTVVTLCATDFYTGFYTVPMRRELGYTPARSWITLSQAPYDHKVTRTGENTFELQVLEGEMLSTPMERLLRSVRHPLEAGDRVTVEGWSIAVLETGMWGPSRITVTCAEPLDSEKYLFLSWDDGQLHRFSWPAIGESVRLRQEEGYFAWPYFKKRLGLG